MTNGKLIVIEGSDGAGKATQMNLLTEYCEKNSVPFATFDFPQYDKTFFGKMCGQFLRGEYGSAENLPPYLIALPYAADRWQAKDNIQKALSEGKIVFINRYAASNAVYQGAKLSKESREAFIDWNFQLEYTEFGIPREDFVLYLHVPVEISQKLIDQKADRTYLNGKKKDMYEENITLLKTTEELYEQFCQKYPHWSCIECSENGSIYPKEKIHAKIISALQNRRLLP